MKIIALSILILAVNVLGQQIYNTYSTSAQKLNNPERGLFSSRYEDVLTTSLLNSTPYSLIHRYYYLKGLNNQDIPADRLNKISQDFANIRATGKKIIPRFAYTDDYNGWDAPLNIIKRHIDQVAPILNQNADVIMAIQAGFIGPWGEWHNSKNNVDKKSVLEYELLKFPKSVQITLRYPYDKMSLIGTTITSLGDAVSFTSSRARVGHQNDCVLYNIYDRGTYQGKFGYTAERDFAKKDSLYHVVGGETCGIQNDAESRTRAQCPSALKEFADYHWTFLNSGYEMENSIKALQNGNCWETIQNRLGYQLFLRESKISHKIYNVLSNEAITYSFKIENLGFAPPVNNRPINLVLVNGSQRIYVPLRGTGHNLKEWIPGVRTISGSISKTILASRVSLSTLVGKTYSLRLQLPDASSKLNTNPKYSIGFVNYVFDAVNGDNDLKLSITFKNSATVLEEEGEEEYLSY